MCNYHAANDSSTVDLHTAKNLTTWVDHLIHNMEDVSQATVIVVMIALCVTVVFHMISLIWMSVLIAAELYYRAPQTLPFVLVSVLIAAELH